MEKMEENMTYQHYKGYIYPLSGEIPDIDKRATCLLSKDKFTIKKLGNRRYLIWITESSCGVQHCAFGSCRLCTGKEIASFEPLLKSVLGDIDTAKLKYIDYCWYDSTECTVDYYEPTKTMTLDEAIAHAKYNECGKEHQRLAEWLQELKVQRDRVDVLTEQVNIYEAHLKMTQDSLAYYIDECNKNEVILASYEDKTYISAEWLVKNGFEFKIGDKDDPDYYLYCNDVVEITAILRNEEAVIWEIYIQFLDHGDTEVLNICTVGQMRMFLAIEGLGSIAKQFKTLR